MLPEKSMPGEKGADEGRADFGSLIASTLHDMKNSLTIVLDSLEACIPDMEAGGHQRLGQLQVEAKRLNGKMIQLLSFYRMDKAMLSANLAEWNVHDVLMELLLQETPLLDSKHIEGEILCEEDLVWVFDRELVTGVLGNAINNAIRHARRQLTLEARCEDGCLVITVQDDGPGYPDSMLENTAASGPGVSFASGNTGLGLYFSRTIATMHRRNGQTGHIRLANRDEEGGARFSLHLP